MRTQSVDGSVKRVVATAITVVAVVFIIAVSYVFYGKEEVVSTQVRGNSLLANSEIDSEVLTKVYEQDSDGDGLADWEEILWSTDPYNSDTDGDGITDNDEIFEQEDSLVSVMGSENEESEINTSKEKDATPPTSTAVLAKDIFSSYMYSLQKGANLSPQEQEVMINEALEKVAPLVQAPVYTKDDVYVVPATPKSRALYIKTVREKVFTMITSTENEDSAFLALTQTDNDWAVQTLTEMVDVYSKYANELRTIPVPDDAVTLHVNFVQTLLQYAYAIEGFSLINTDPLRAAASVNVFQNIRSRLVQTVSIFNKYVEIHEGESASLQNTN